ncbi:expressed unknown protein [Seminavis robusta]|uniref:Fungal lipase-type domain-containing protein n=1 Tax=Seminavis robusta TaxID=568900 RepID=A0A9N8DIG4_9STRA|nr:expressed unknown protein [Seminavis robusta]|eukprot:Sro101_g051600.1 n/a (297) ;mRNA; r:53219-54257
MRNICRALSFGLLLAHRAMTVHAEGRNLRRRTSSCNEEQDADGLTLELPELMVDNIADVEQLVGLTTEAGAFKHPSNPGFDAFQVFSDINDAAIVARRGNSCFAVFRATTFVNPFDIMQLYDWSKRSIGSCTVRGGIYKAYQRSSYSEDFVVAVDECMASGDNNFFLAGHSQGGAIATVASIDLKRHNPMVITFGAVRSILGGADCSDVNPERHFRFVNAADNNYDFWPAQFNRDNQAHVGHAILLDPQATQPAAYVGLNDNTNRSPQDRVHHLPVLVKHLKDYDSRARAQVKVQV